ncbi:hypothetical protein [Kitasatospora cineracea]|uniref:hypothetical protein n=1 Tax=Kitasatospora cineracea TaxID=88074 RepID=UPI00382BD594
MADLLHCELGVDLQAEEVGVDGQPAVGIASAGQRQTHGPVAAEQLVQHQRDAVVAALLAPRVAAGPVLRCVPGGHLVLVEGSDDVVGEDLDEVQAPRQQGGHRGRMDPRGEVLRVAAAVAKDIRNPLPAEGRGLRQPVALGEQVAQRPGDDDRREQVFALIVRNFSCFDVDGVVVQVLCGDVAEALDSAGVQSLGEGFEVVAVQGDGADRAPRQRSLRVDHQPDHQFDRGAERRGDFVEEHLRGLGLFLEQSRCQVPARP